MGEDPIRYIKPHWFDWGMFKANGKLIFFTTGALYLACFILSVKLIRRVGRRLGYPRVILVVGLVGLVPMVFKAVESLEVQMTSAHYQESTQIPAVITIAASFAAVVVLWLAVE